MIVGYALHSGFRCVSCTPALQDTYYVTCAGLAGCFAVFNGKTTVPWFAQCSWRVSWDLGGGITALVQVYYLGGTRWEGSVQRAGCAVAASKIWVQGSDTPCGPTNAYSEHQCTVGNGCGCGANDCTNSAGATFVVSTS